MTDQLPQTQTAQDMQRSRVLHGVGGRQLEHNVGLLQGCSVGGKEGGCVVPAVAPGGPVAQPQVRLTHGGGACAGGWVGGWVSAACVSHKLPSHDCSCLETGAGSLMER